MANSNGRPNEEEMEMTQSLVHGATDEPRPKECQQRISDFIENQNIQQRTADRKENANSFGTIEFEGFDKFENKRAPYIRVADDTDVKKLWKLMIEEWKIPKPKMIISITDGAKHSAGRYKDRLKKLFNEGLVKAAIATDAWIINDGSAHLVMQKLGRATRPTEEEEKVVTLGIADWNVTSNREALTNSSSTGGLWPAKYKSKDCRKGDLGGIKSALDCHNSHFILVDPLEESEPADINLRARLEQYIQGNAHTNSSDEENTGILVALVVVGGDYETITTVNSAVEKNETNDNKRVLIFGGGGGAGDIIIAALHLMDKNKFNDNDSVQALKNDIQHQLGLNSERLNTCVDLLEKISDPRHRKLITVFQMDDLKDIDGKNLSAVFRGMKISKFIRDHDIKQRTVDGKEEANSFGEIEFEGFDKFETKRAQYIRVAEDTPVETLWELMVGEWKIPKPKMIISVTGGAKHFVGWNEDRLKTLFNQGLFKAAFDTDSWIITGGTAAGVIKKLGKAIMEESQLAKKKKIVALGIATWKVINNREALTDLSSKRGLWRTKYSKDDLKKEDGDGFVPALDCNHTHFILVDEAKTSDSTDIKFRAKLEQYIKKEGEKELESVDINTFGKGNTTIPVVLVVVEGGYGTIETVHLALVQDEKKGEDGKIDGIPVVIVGGSGRAADIIVKALSLMKNNEFDDKNADEDLKNDIKYILGITDSKSLEVCVTWLKEISDSRRRKMITVFQMDDANLKDIDSAILKAALPALPDETQLDLAFSLDRCDIAKDEILKPDKLFYWQQNIKHLNKTMVKALIQNKADFVELLLTYLVNMGTLVKQELLEELYFQVVYEKINDADIISSTRQILKEKCEKNNKLVFEGVRDAKNRKKKFGDTRKIEYKHVHDLLLKLTNDEYDEPDYSEKTGLNISSPDKHIFMWAVLLNRRSLAILFWKRLTTGNIGAALIASRILRALAKYAEKIKDLRLQSSLKKHAEEFEDLAIHLLESCYEADTKRSELILVRPLPAWGNTTCLSIAYSANLMNFMKCDCCQRKVYDVWMGNLSIYSWKQWLAFFVGIILPIFPLMSFRGIENKDDTSSEAKSFANYFFRCGPDCHSTDFGVRRSGFGEKDVTFWEGMRYYYTAPITKFVYSLVSYLILLVLYAIFLLTDLRPSEEEDSPSTIEWIVIVWVCTLVVEEIRQLVVRKPKSMKRKTISWYSHVWNRYDFVKKKAISWSSDVWNRFDLIMYVMFAVSVILRFALSPCRFAIARVMYSLTFILFSVRLLPLGFVFEGVGPKIIMISRMMKDLRLFLYILMIFVASFGIANEAILNPNVESSYNLIFRSLYKPYWRLYGELLLEEDEELVGNTTSSQDHRLMNVCPQVDAHQWVAPTLTAIYMLISNILLVNLLIAMFSYTFQSVQDNAALYWKFYRFGLISEYHDRPTLAPPLIIINHVNNLIIRLTKCGLHKEFSSLCVKLKKDDDEALNLFEKKHLQNYFIKKNRQQVDTTEKRVDKVINEIGECKNGSHAGLKRVEERLLTVEKTMESMGRNIEDMLKIMKRKK